jgi:hypothetical protein
VTRRCPHIYRITLTYIENIDIKKALIPFAPIHEVAQRRGDEE